MSIPSVLRYGEFYEMPNLPKKTEDTLLVHEDLMGWGQGEAVEPKVTNAMEARAYSLITALTPGPRYLPVLLHPPQPMANNKYKIVVQKRGSSLDDMPGLVQFLHDHWGHFESDLFAGLFELNRAGIKHLDLEHIGRILANITYDPDEGPGGRFYLIDFDKIAFKHRAPKKVLKQWQRILNTVKAELPRWRKTSRAPRGCLFQGTQGTQRTSGTLIESLSAAPPSKKVRFTAPSGTRAKKSL